MPGGAGPEHKTEECVASLPLASVGHALGSGGLKSEVGRYREWMMRRRRALGGTCTVAALSRDHRACSPYEFDSHHDSHSSTQMYREHRH